MPAETAPRIGPYGAILDIARTLAAGDSLETTMHRVAECVGRAMFAESARLGSYHRELDEYVHEASWREGGETQRDREGVGQVYRLAEEYPELRRQLETHSMQELHIDDPGLSANDREFLTRWGLKTNLEQPLMFGGRVIGLLSVGESRFARRYTPTERGLFAQLCDLAAIGVHSARQTRLLEETRRRLERSEGRLAELQS